MITRMVDLRMSDLKVDRYKEEGMEWKNLITWGL